MSTPSDPVLEFIRLMWSVDHELQRISRRMVTQIGLTAPQRLAVRFVGRQPGLTLGNLAELLHLHPGTVTGIVRVLEQRGFVTRERSSDDRRRKGTVEAAVRRIAADLTPAELESASEVLKRLAEELASE
jgi:DNA-binding MarR family transcriptional regulator